MQSKASVVKQAFWRAANSLPSAAIVAVSSITAMQQWALWPIVIGSVAEFYWLFFAVKTGRYDKQVIEAERRAQARAAVQKRDRQIEHIERVFATSVFRTWVAQNIIPDYPALWSRLNDVRNRVAQVARDRQEITQAFELDTTQRLDRMLARFPTLVLGRILYLQAFSGITVESMKAAPETEDASLSQSVRELVAGFRGETRTGEDRRGRKIHDPYTPKPDVAARIAEINAKIEALQARIKEEQGTADMRMRHIETLRGSIRQLQSFSERDQQAVAQLEMLPDTFDLVATQLSAARVNTSDITTALEAAVAGVEETTRFIEEMTPFTDDMLEESAFVGS